MFEIKRYFPEDKSAWNQFVANSKNGTFLLDRAIGGPDAAFSMTIDEFKTMVTSIRNVEKALGKVDYPTDPSMISGRQFARSLYIAEDMKAGDVLTETNLRSVRPGYGLHPRYLNECLGKQVNKDLKKGERFMLDFLRQKSLLVSI